MVAMTDAPVRKGLDREAVDRKARQRKRSIEEGRITTLGTPALGRCITFLAQEIGILPTTFSRMLIVEALIARGYTMKRIEAEFGDDGIRAKMMAAGLPVPVTGERE